MLASSSLVSQSSVELPRAQIEVEPSHASLCDAAGPLRHNHPESLKGAFASALLPAISKPQNSERKRAVDGSLRFPGARSDDRPRPLPANQNASRIRRSKAVFQIHGRAQTLNFVALEGTCEHAFHKAQILASGKGPQLECGNRDPARVAETCRSSRPQPPDQNAKHVLARFQADNRAYQVPLSPTRNAERNGHARRKAVLETGMSNSTRPSSSNAAWGCSARNVSSERASSNGFVSDLDVGMPRP